MKKKTKITIAAAAVAAALVSAAAGFSSLNHTYTIDDEYAVVISALVSGGHLESPGINFKFYDIKKYFTPEDPAEENAYKACAYELWCDSVELTLFSYYTMTRGYEAEGTDIHFEVTELTDDYTVLHYYGTGVVITSFEEETVDDYWYIDMKPFWKGEAPGLYKMEKPLSPEEASDKWYSEHPDVLERLKSGSLEDYCTE